MQALVTVLPDPYYQAVEELWAELDAKFGCQHVYVRPKPHFTWQYAEEYAPNYAEVLEQLCHKFAPIEVKTDVVTTFSELDPVLFVRIIQTPELLEIHRLLWEALLPLGHEPCMLYEPGVWVPHITLSNESWCNLAGAKKYLIDKDTRWTFMVETLVMLYLGDDNAWGVEQEFRLGMG